ncbi:MAG: hypothetical protein EBX49_03080 [Synechococcaceae bacterium WB8_1B_136]|nr:hypothetical protein [Synechococcaceae bacterium WB8_1B_136]
MYALDRLALHVLALQFGADGCERVAAGAQVQQFMECARQELGDLGAESVGQDQLRLGRPGPRRGSGLGGGQWMKRVNCEGLMRHLT